MLGSRLLCGAAILLASAAAAGNAGAKQVITTFDPAGSIYTFAAGINASGTVAGYYEDSTGVTHGFVRMSDGTITAFDPTDSAYTEATGINTAGEIAGWYRDTTGAYYGFIRGTDGTITRFNPTKGNPPGVIGLNEKGKVAGWYTMSDYQEGGFVGMADGKIKQLTVEGMAINSKGAVTGMDGTEGFVRSPSGKMVSFTAPGSPTFTVPTSINDSGEVAVNGATICGISHGYSRNTSGVFTAVNPPNAEESTVVGVNDKGALTGYYYYGGYHGFVQSPGGAYTSFDVTGATYGTYPQSINTKGEVAGGYRDASDVLHGFVGKP